MPVKYLVANQKITHEKLARAKELRREMTPAEDLLWHELRTNKLGAHFRRQQIISGFIVDFYCHKSALVIEVDGGIHRSRDQRESDDIRDRALRDLGLRVLRIKNEEVVDAMPLVLDRVRALLHR